MANGFFFIGDCSAKSSSSNLAGATLFLFDLPSTSDDPSSGVVTVGGWTAVYLSYSLRLGTSVGVVNVIVADGVSGAGGAIPGQSTSAG